jgi:thermostable 8-oxoguanine DNA glycosylase
MVLLECPECSGKVSTKAATCPHCGWPVEPSTKVDLPKGGQGAVRELLHKMKDDPFVTLRWERNVRVGNPAWRLIWKNETEFRIVFWKGLMVGLLTSQQKSGPGSSIGRLMGEDPDPIGYEICNQQNSAHDYIKEVLSDWGGIRFINRIPSFAHEGLDWLEGGGWAKLYQKICKLAKDPSIDIERDTSDFLQKNIKGIGPKQARNVLQVIGITQFVVPIDSRLTRWFDNYKVFSPPLATLDLSRNKSYEYAEGEIQKLCERLNVLPCILDAAIFASSEAGEWSGETFYG